MTADFDASVNLDVDAYREHRAWDPDPLPAWQFFAYRNFTASRTASTASEAAPTAKGDISPQELLVMTASITR